MEDLLTAVRTTATSTKSSREESAKDPIGRKDNSNSISTNSLSLELALHTLKNEPDFDTLRSILSYLSSTVNGPSKVSITTAGPLSAQLIGVLINTTIPDFWSSHLRYDGSEDKNNPRHQLISCLRSVTGIGAILAKLRALNSDVKQGKHLEKLSSIVHVQDLLEVLTVIMQDDSFVRSIWKSINGFTHSESQRVILWKEFVSLIASGKVIAVTAQAQDSISTSSSELKPTLWISDGNRYARWLGRNLTLLIEELDVAEKSLDAAVSRDLAQIASKALTLGYTDAMIEETLDMTVKADRNCTFPVKDLLVVSKAYERRQYIQSVLRVIDKRYLDFDISADHDMKSTQGRSISGAAALVKEIILSDSGSPGVKQSFLDTITTIHTSGVTLSVAMTRVALAALSSEHECMQTILEKAMTSFGDQLFIRHTPIIQQEAIAQLLLISAGYVHRSQPMYLFTLARSSTHLNAISNRLSASSPRARFLGMVVGTAISKLIDKAGSRMDFGTEELETEEAKTYLDLVHINDRVGTVQDLLEASPTARGRVRKLGVASKPSERKDKPAGASPNGRAQTAIQGPRITEVEDDEEDDTMDDLVPYTKPDSDPEDEDEDPTVVNRNKPTAPVYVRDLIAGLRDTENHDRQRLALTSAASLIRRKANFGKELADRAQELASTLVGLSDPFEIANFEELRLQAMIALVVAEPAQLGPWFAKTFFEGDYSIMQRISILTALGMGARELGGFKDEDAHLTGADSVSNTPFPSKLLPEKYHKMYISGTIPVNSITKRLEQNIIGPLALTAADHAAGPNAFKVRTFSSRVEVEKRRKKPVANALAPLVGDKIIFPLTGRWWTHMQAYGARSKDNIHISPLLLVPYLRTLALILHAAGPSSPDLPSTTSEFWTLLLSLLQTPALNAAADFDVTVLEAVLFSLLTMIELNIENDSGQRVVRDQAKELLETQAWVDGIFDRLGGSSKDEEGQRVRALAAGLLIKMKEIVEKYQRSLVGSMMDF